MEYLHVKLAIPILLLVPPTQFWIGLVDSITALDLAIQQDGSKPCVQHLQLHASVGQIRAQLAPTCVPGQVVEAGNYPWDLLDSQAQDCEVQI